MVYEVTASTCAFSVPFVLTCRSGNRQVSFHLCTPQQASLSYSDVMTKSHPNVTDITAELYFPSIHIHCLEPFHQPHPSSPTVFQVRHDACGGFRQPAFAGP